MMPYWGVGLVFVLFVTNGPAGPSAAPPLAREGGGPGGSRALFLLPDPMETCRRTHWKEGEQQGPSPDAGCRRKDLPALSLVAFPWLDRPNPRGTDEKGRGARTRPASSCCAGLPPECLACRTSKNRIESNRIGGRQERLLPTAEGGLGSRSCWRMEAASTGEPSRRDYYCLYK
jgi:hypothetical protein